MITLYLAFRGGSWFVMEREFFYETSYTYHMKLTDLQAKFFSRVLPLWELTTDEKKEEFKNLPEPDWFAEAPALEDRVLKLKSMIREYEENPLFNSDLWSLIRSTAERIHYTFKDYKTVMVREA